VSNNKVENNIQKELHV